MCISFEIPRHIEQENRSDGLDMNHRVKEAYLVNLYRAGTD